MGIPYARCERRNGFRARGVVEGAASLLNHHSVSGHVAGVEAVAAGTSDRTRPRNGRLVGQ